MNSLLKRLMSLHAGIYRASGGKVMGKMGKAPMLLLTTTGRKTGKRRTMPLLYLEDGNSLVVVASAGGQPKHPAWYANLQAEPAVEVQIGRAVRKLRARTATAEERARLWQAVVALYPGYGRYQEKTTREIPLVILEPARAGAAARSNG